MKVIDIRQFTLEKDIVEAQHQRVMLTNNGKPVALLVGLQDVDEEQLQWASSDAFWKMVTQRRAQKTLNRSELERRM
jgi:PHD/YefM family antitoxin component YafN of YafNO toxin-antitoxin module